MKVVILYRPQSEHASAVEQYVHEFEKDYPDKSLELVDVDSREGMATAALYDVVRYPAVIAMADDGAQLSNWQGDQLPLKDEVLAYAPSS